MLGCKEGSNLPFNLPLPPYIACPSDWTMPQPEYVQPPLFPEFSSSLSQDALPEDAVLAEEEPTKADPGDAPPDEQRENLESGDLEPDALESGALESGDSELDHSEPDHSEPYELLDELNEPLDEFVHEPDEPLAEPLAIPPDGLDEPPDPSQLYQPLDEYAEDELDGLDGLDDRPSDLEWLDESSLKTILDMLAVIDSVEELAMLEALTPLQKRQVWNATPDSIKLRLKQLRSANTHRNIEQLAPIQSVPWENLESVEDVENLENLEDFQDLADLVDTENTGTAAAIDHALSDSSFPRISFPSETKTVVSDDLDAHALVLNQPIPIKGDCVVLKAKPKLTAAELTAIWTVTDVHEGYARIQAKGMTRHYPIAWMVIYPKSTLEDEA